MNQLLKIKTEMTGLPNKSFVRLFKKNDQNELFHQELLLNTAFLDANYSDVTLQQRFYHFWFGVSTELCPICNKPRKFNRINKFTIIKIDNYYKTCDNISCRKIYNIEQTKRGMLLKYGVENISQTQLWHDKVKETNQKNHGVDYPTQMIGHSDKVREASLLKHGVAHHTQVKSIQDKKKKTNIGRYGVGQVMQNVDIKNRAHDTNIVRYGGISSMCSDVTKEKSKNTMRERYGVDWYTQTEELKAALRERNIKKYGVSSQMQDAEFFTKTMFKRKEYVFPSGRLEKVQGYEHLALNSLLADGVDEHVIILAPIQMEMIFGKVWYVSDDRKQHRYYPDIYISTENKIIEVKSWYTLDKHRKANEAKKQAVLALGVDFEFWIYDEQGNLTILK